MSVTVHFYLKNPIFDIVMPYKSLWQKKVLHKTESIVLLLKKARFPSHLVLGIYVANHARTGNLRRNRVQIKNIQGKRILQASSISIYVI